MGSSPSRSTIFNVMRKQLTTSKKKKLQELVNSSCQKCGTTDPSSLQYHHIDAVCVGGTNDLTNLSILCYSCHKEYHSTYGKRATRETFIEFISLEKYQTYTHYSKESTEKTKASIDMQILDQVYLLKVALRNLELQNKITKDTISRLRIENEILKESKGLFDPDYYAEQLANFHRQKIELLEMDVQKLLQENAILQSKVPQPRAERVYFWSKWKLSRKLQFRADG